MAPDSCPPSKPGLYPSDCEILEGYRTMARNQSGRPARSAAWLAALAKARPVKILLLDVDGVLTDGSLIYSHEGLESKAFNTQDGFGLRLLQEAGLEIGVITARSSEAVARRCANLKMRYVYQGIGNKLEAYREILQQSSCKPFEIAYMGDDWLDLALLNRAGFAAAPANGVREVQEAVHYTTEQSGGHGAVRELCNLILEAKGMYQELLQSYISR
jgi:3-deoxy-D-manno-octulosonate 8-phosphate phosphatase (KDO 8-P phosphatase)